MSSLIFIYRVSGLRRFGEFNLIEHIGDKIMSKKAFFFFLLLVFFSITNFTGGCDDHDYPTVPGKARDYPIYFCDFADSPSELFTFYPGARRVDSVNLNWQPRTMQVSADGRILYFNNRDGSHLAVNASNLAIIAELPGYVFNVSPDNELIAISNNGINILNTSNYSVVFKDSTLPRQSCVFSSDSRYFYCNASDTVYKIDLTDSSYPTTKIDITTEGSIVHVLPSVDETKLFLNVHIQTWLWAFEVYDIILDSIVFCDYLIPGYGHFTLSLDGRYVFYTNPGRTGTDPFPLLGFKIFDVEANRIYRVIEDTSFFSDTNWYAPPGLPVVTPDSRWLVMLGGVMNYGMLFLYDIEGGELVHREDWGGYYHLFAPSLAVQYYK